MIRKPEMQVDHMLEANVRPHYSARRPESDIETEEQDAKRRTKCNTREQ